MYLSFFFLFVTLFTTFLTTGLFTLTLLFDPGSGWAHVASYVTHVGWSDELFLQDDLGRENRGKRKNESILIIPSRAVQHRVSALRVAMLLPTGE
ncbi:MAG: hypothetical protein ACREBU_19695 [Nitrososphaera sp.]